MIELDPPDPRPTARPWPGVGEVRCNPDGTVDEIVADGVSVHLEQLRDGQWWMMLSAPDGTALRVVFTTRRGAAIVALAESEEGPRHVAAGWDAKGRAIWPGKSGD